MDKYASTDYIYKDKNVFHSFTLHYNLDFDYKVYKNDKKRFDFGCSN